MRTCGERERHRYRLPYAHAPARPHVPLPLATKPNSNPDLTPESSEFFESMYGWYGGDDPNVKNDETKCDFYTGSSGMVTTEEYVRVHRWSLVAKEASWPVAPGSLVHREPPQGLVVNLPHLLLSLASSTDKITTTIQPAIARAVTATAHWTRPTITPSGHISGFSTNSSWDFLTTSLNEEKRLCFVAIASNETTSTPHDSRED